MFKLVITVSALAAIVTAQYGGSGSGGVSGDRNAHITSQTSQLNHDGTYQHSFTASNGIAQQESGAGGHFASGSFQYYSPEGIPISLTYTADENGFQPKGDHLPTPPPIPDHVLKTLEYIRTHPQQQQQDKHGYY